MKVRLSVPADAPLLWPLIEQQLHELGPDVRKAFDPLRMWQHLESLWREQPSTHKLWVAESHSQQVVGVLLACLQPYYWRAGFQAQVVHWYVQPASRGSSAALRLVLTLVDWAQQHHACETMIGITSGIAPERSHRLLARAGFENVGCNYVRSGLCKSH